MFDPHMEPSWARGLTWACLGLWPLHPTNAAHHHQDRQSSTAQPCPEVHIIYISLQKLLTPAKGGAGGGEDQRSLDDHPYFCWNSKQQSVPKINRRTNAKQRASNKHGGPGVFRASHPVEIGSPK